jgi:Pyridine nucleotide-disulphide oxidoreductase, dimerisation domain
VCDILGQGGPPTDYRAVPRVTFTDPEIGSVGLTEAHARDAGVRVAVGLARVPSSARGWIHKAGNHGIIKVVADTKRDVLVGATSAGPAGGEVLSALAVAVHAEVTVGALRRMIYAYPTSTAASKMPSASSTNVSEPPSRPRGQGEIGTRTRGYRGRSWVGSCDLRASRQREAALPQPATWGWRPVPSRLTSAWAADPGRWAHTRSTSQLHAKSCSTSSPSRTSVVSPERLPTRSAYWNG